MYDINMKKLSFSPALNKKNKYLVAVSGGPDSMALLHALVAQGYQIEVAHVNYKQRPSADRDQGIVENYCFKNNIKFHLLTNQENPVKNFQNWARDYRYRFFKEIAQKIGIKTLLVAHHQDDLLETYLIKKTRSGIYSSIALSNKSIILGLKIIRPLLNYSKADLINYCQFNNVKYGIDETNLEAKYLRNRIRIETLSKINKEQRQKLLREIKLKEKEIAAENQLFKIEYQKLISNKTLNYLGFENLSNEFKIRVLYKFISENTTVSPRLLSRKKLIDFIKQFTTKKPNISINLGLGNRLIKAYGLIRIANKDDAEEFNIIVSKLKFKTYQNFKLSKSGSSLEGVHVLETDFPLTVRSFNYQDRLVIKNGHKLISRLFIDKKVAKDQRKKIAVLVNVKAEILLVSKYYVNPTRKGLQNNLFVVQ
jgi:tRNA(Ile)-lysidine synthetase-like protein